MKRNHYHLLYSRDPFSGLNAKIRCLEMFMSKGPDKRVLFFLEI